MLYFILRRKGAHKMNAIFSTIAQYLIKNPESRDKKAHEIYNDCISNSSYKPRTFNDVKIVLDYINSIKKTPNNVLLDATKGELA